MANKIQQRRGLKSAIPTLSAGELGYTTDTRELFIGTGSGNVNVGGSHWYRGTAMSGTSTITNNYSYSACPQVKLNDLYLNTSNGNVYACTTAGSGSSAKWTYQGCIKGATGATGATGANGQDLQAVYSTTPTQVGTWIDGKTIYRVVWSTNKNSLLSNFEDGSYGLINITDFPGAPNNLSNASNLINERYIIAAYSGMENVVVADRYQLKEIITSSYYKQTSNNFTVYAIVEYTKN